MQVLVNAFVRYHRGLGRMPARWRPWLISLLIANMILPWVFITRLEARVVFVVALLNGAFFVLLTAASGFSRLLGLGHLFWVPLIFFLWPRLEQFPIDTFYGTWLRALVVLNSVSVVLDAVNVFLYCRGDREELVSGL
jgi:hypothetical protein